MAVPPINHRSTTGAVALRSVVPADATDLPDGVCRGLGCLVAGTASVVALADDTPQTIYLVPGAVHPVRAKRVRATGTTATGIVAYY